MLQSLQELLALNLLLEGFFFFFWLYFLYIAFGESKCILFVGLQVLSLIVLNLLRQGIFWGGHWFFV